MPSLIRHAMVYNWETRRHAIGQELVTSQGVPLLPNCGTLCPWQPLVDAGNLSQNALVSLAGNGMNCYVVTSLICYILSRTAPHATPTIPRSVPGSESEADEVSNLHFEFDSYGAAAG